MSRAMRKSSAFTLVELITVIAIIAILLSLIVGVGSGARKRARINQAKVEIAALETAVHAYKTDMGNFPIDASGASVNVDLVRQLSGLDSSGSVITSLSDEWNGPYMEFDRARLDSASGEFLDPWRTAYHVRGIGDDLGTTEADLHNKFTFDIWSSGPDKIDELGAEGSDDIGNF